MAIHLTIGGSTAERTLNCPGWIKRSEKYPKRKAGAAAIEGSMHHTVQEMCQKTGVEPRDCLGFVYEEDDKRLIFTEDHLDLSEIAYNATNELLDTLDIDEMLVEAFLQIVKGTVGGSIDLLGLSENGETLLILDYKFGSYRVRAEANKQMLFYARCVEADPSTRDMLSKVKKIVLAVVQPKVKGVVDTWSCGPQELDDFNATLVKAMDEVFSENPRIAAGSHCQWCPAEPYCAEKRQAVFSATLLDQHSHNELCAAADEVVRVENWVKAVKEELFMQLERGVQVPGWKIVEKRAQRKWADTDGFFDAVQAADGHTSEFLESKLLTPAQAEKVIKKNKLDISLQDFIVSTSSGHTLATEDDSREAVVVTDVAPNLEKLVKSN